MNRRASDRALREERALDRPGGKRKGPRKSLRHLPEGKRTEIAWIKDLIFAEFAEAISGRRADGVRDGKILKIILHGPYASGAWFDDPAGAYFADYEFLVVVSSDKLADVGEFWSECERKLLFAACNRVHLQTQARLLVRSLSGVADQIEGGNRYFRDIVECGVVLYDTPEHPLPDCVPGHSVEAKLEGNLHLEEGLGLVDEFLGSAKLSFANGWYRKAAFDLHQATERLYTVILLVFTDHAPQTHNLVQLRKLVEPLDARFRAVWPAMTKEERRCFELLRGAYNKSRYDRYYRVTEGELRWMLAEVDHLCDLTEEVCGERIASFSPLGESVGKARSGGPRSQSHSVDGRHLGLTDRGRQIIADYYAAVAAYPDQVVDERLLPHPKKEIKIALLAALREADDLETVRRLTESFLELSRWLLLSDHDLAALEAHRASVEGGGGLDCGLQISGSYLTDYGRLANRVAANTIILGAELQRAERGLETFPTAKLN